MIFSIPHDLRVIVQGVTGRAGGLHSQDMTAYGTRVVAGVTPGNCAGGSGAGSSAGKSSGTGTSPPPILNTSSRLALPFA